jgi:hypothetical protein
LGSDNHQQARKTEQNRKNILYKRLNQQSQHNKENWINQLQEKENFQHAETEKIRQFEEQELMKKRKEAWDKQQQQIQLEKEKQTRELHKEKMRKEIASKERKKQIDKLRQQWNDYENDKIRQKPDDDGKKKSQTYYEPMDIDAGGRHKKTQRSKHNKAKKNRTKQNKKRKSMRRKSVRRKT